MGKTVMVTRGFELTEERVEVARMDLNKYTYDDRMEMLVLRNVVENVDPLMLYRTYVQSFCETINRNRNCKPAYMTACGFLPVGIEPLILCNRVNKEYIIPVLFEKGIEYFQLKPMSPVLSSYEPTSAMAVSHDIWINKLDAAKLVGKPPHNVTALDVLEVIGL